VVGTVVVGKPPPAVQLSEGQVHPAQPGQVLQRDQLPRWSEKFPAMCKCLFQISRCVEDIRGNNQVVTVRVEALRNRVLLDIQRHIPDASSGVAEPRFRFGKEACGNVRIDVVETSLGKFRQHRSGGGPGARSDLDHPQAPIAGQRGHQGTHRLGQQPVCRSGHRRLQVQIGRGRLAAAEQQGQGILLAAKHLAQGLARPLEQPDFGETVGIGSSHPLGPFIQVPGHFGGQGIVGTQ